MENTGHYDETLAERFTRFFQNHDYKYSFDRNKGILKYVIAMKAGGNCLAEVHFFEDGASVQGFIIRRIPKSEEILNRFYRLLNQYNCLSRIGAFSLILGEKGAEGLIMARFFLHRSASAAGAVSEAITAPGAMLESVYEALAELGGWDRKEDKTAFEEEEDFPEEKLTAIREQIDSLPDGAVKTRFLERYSRLEELFAAGSDS